MIKATLNTTKLDKAFRYIPTELDNAMKKALDECSKVIIENCKKSYMKYFKVNTGEAINAIYIKKITEKKIDIAIDTKVKHAIYLHEGTRAHWIEPIEANALAWIGAGGKFCYSMGHSVSGIKGHKFLDEGLAASKEQCTTIINKYIDEAFRKTFK